MEENKIPTSVYVTLIICVIVLGIGYYVWSSTQSEKPIDTNQETAAATQAAPTETTAVVPSVAPVATPIVESPQSLKNLMHTITIETNKGSIVFQTYDQDAPKAAQNFVTLANKGFYNGVIFHRVIKGFMIQGGDPTGTGTGGPGYTFEDELDPNTASAKAGYKRGVVAMANSGPNTNGSQFFIMHQDYPLPHNYTILGKVIKGIEIVDAIATVKTGAGDKPLDPIVMKKVTAVENK